MFRPAKKRQKGAEAGRRGPIRLTPDAKLTLAEKRRLAASVAKAKKDGKIPRTAQQTIPYQEMRRDGICVVNSHYFTKQVQFFDINYQLAQNEDKRAIFENWCDFLNYFDSSIRVQFSFLNETADMEERCRSIEISSQQDSLDRIRRDYSDMIVGQLAKGNNGYSKTKYITFGIEAESLKAAKPRLERIEADILANFKAIGVHANPLDGYERLAILHGMFHPYDNQKFRFAWDAIWKTGLSSKDFIAPDSFTFKNSRTFQIGKTYGSMSFLQILAPELTDRIGEAYQSIRSGQCDVMLAGGSDAVICPQGIAAFGQMRALTMEDDPARASIPFDKNRGGFVMGEGAGVLVVEDLEHARKRNAAIYGELIGYGCTNDAYHVTVPGEDGEAAAKAMELAMENAGISPEQVSYINAHGTGTYYNDLCETRAIKRAFGQYAYGIPVNSTKSLIGHTLAGSGAIEAIVCLLSMRDSYLHVTAGLQETEEECNLDYIKGSGRKQTVEVAMSNSFGFGGHNSILIFRKHKEQT